MPPAQRKPRAPSDAPTKAAIAETTETTDDTVSVQFRGIEIVARRPDKILQSFSQRMALIDADNAKTLAIVIGPRGTAQIASVIDEKVDNFDAIVTEFFEAYGKATGSGNSSSS